MLFRSIELASRVRDAKWRLVNREVEDGMVKITADEQDVLIAERIRTIISSGLPLDVPESIAREFLPWSDKIMAAVQERTLAEFGAIEESAYPPCIQALISAAAAGENISHSGRFSMTAIQTISKNCLRDIILQRYPRSRLPALLRYTSSSCRLVPYY